MNVTINEGNQERGKEVNTRQLRMQDARRSQGPDMIQYRGRTKWSIDKEEEEVHEQKKSEEEKG
jgi:hypothetical protein